MKNLVLIILILSTLNTSSQNVGIGTAAPLARLHVTDSNVVFSAEGNVSGSSFTPVPGGQGRRMLWYPSKAAFRVGYVTNTNWDKDSIGTYSFAAGRNTRAVGNYASTALGDGAIAVGESSTAIGWGTYSVGYSSLSLGNASRAYGDYSAAIGQGSIAYQFASVAIGDQSQAFGVLSCALGSSLKANAYGSTVVGYNNAEVVSPQVSKFLTSPVFIVGNGFTTRSNAMTVLMNGNVGIGNDAPTEKIVVNGNILVQNGKGLIRSNDGTQQKKIATNVAVAASLAADATTAINFTFSEAFSGTPDVYVGNVVGGAGGWAEVIMTVANISNTGGTLFVHNARTIPWSPNFTIKIIAIGPQ